MARTDGYIQVTKKLSQAPVSEDAIQRVIQEELMPLIDELRRILNQYAYSPSIPVFDHFPPVDADFGADFEARPRDGVISIGSDDNLYVRQGSSTHTLV